MSWFFETIYAAIVNLFSGDSYLYEAVFLTLKVSFIALLIAIFIALPLAAWLASKQGRLQSILIVFIHSMMGFPPILAGLLVYLLLSRQGPMGYLDLLFTPSAMVFAQVILIFPIICGLSQQLFRRQYLYLSDFFYSLHFSRRQRLQTVIYESRYQLLTVIATGLGRGLAEVGAVMIAGGNILHYTRTITTTIALETSKGEIVNSVSLGIILLLLAICINFCLFWVGQRQKRLMGISDEC